MGKFTNRVLSLVVATVYLLAAYFDDGSRNVWYMGMYLLMPLVCSWDSEAMGDYKGMNFASFHITKATPGCFVAFGGWLLLALPAIVVFVTYLTGGTVF